MKVLRGFRDLCTDDIGAPASVVSIGNFDGVHIGHQAVIRSAVSAARCRGVASVVCTFDPHTRMVLRPQAPPRLLETLEQRVHAIGELGVDVVVVVPFDIDVAALPRAEFVTGFLGASLNALELHVSKAFTFGAGGKGDVDYLETVSTEAGFELHVIGSVAAAGGAVSSTRIRDAIAAGHVEDAADLLGRPYALVGDVVHGDRRGAGLGAPTANLSFANGCVPAAGVYVSYARSEGLSGGAITNVGVRPTFESEGEIRVEVHLLDGCGDLYGQRMEVEFLSRLRGERKFADAGALAEQIRNDIERATAYLESS